VTLPTGNGVASAAIALIVVAPLAGCNEARTSASVDAGVHDVAVHDAADVIGADAPDAGIGDVDAPDVACVPIEPLGLLGPALPIDADIVHARWIGASGATLASRFEGAVRRWAVTADGADVISEAPWPAAFDGTPVAFDARGASAATVTATDLHPIVTLARVGYDGAVLEDAATPIEGAGDLQVQLLPGEPVVAIITTWYPNSDRIVSWWLKLGGEPIPMNEVIGLTGLDTVGADTVDDDAFGTPVDVAVEPAATGGSNPLTQLRIGRDGVPERPFLVHMAAESPSYIDVVTDGDDTLVSWTEPGPVSDLRAERVHDGEPTRVTALDTVPGVNPAFVSSDATAGRTVHVWQDVDGPTMWAVQAIDGVYGAITRIHPPEPPTQMLPLPRIDGDTLHVAWLGWSEAIGSQVYVASTPLCEPAP